MRNVTRIGGHVVAAFLAYRPRARWAVQRHKACLCWAVISTVHEKCLAVIFIVHKRCWAVLGAWLRGRHWHWHWLMYYLRNE